MKDGNAERATEIERYKTKQHNQGNNNHIRRTHRWTKIGIKKNVCTLKQFIYFVYGLSTANLIPLFLLLILILLFTKLFSPFYFSMELLLFFSCFYYIFRNEVKEIKRAKRKEKPSTWKKRKRNRVIIRSNRESLLFLCFFPFLLSGDWEKK